MAHPCPLDAEGFICLEVCFLQKYDILHIYDKMLKLCQYLTNFGVFLRALFGPGNEMYSSICCHSHIGHLGSVTMMD